MEKIQLIANLDIEDIRLDVYISIQMGTKSRSSIQKLIKSGHIYVNGKVEKASYLVKDEDVIDIEMPEAISMDIDPENIPLNIVYEDGDIIVIDKPKSMVVHPAPGNYSGTMVNALLYHFGESLSSINGIKRPGIVHRIDKDTTGLLVVAKNDCSHNKLSEQFKNHSINREYQMIVLGVPKENYYTVNQPIGRNPKDRLKMAVVPNGRKAITHFKVLERFEKYSYLSATLETGRTHQIRVHSTYAGYPLLGDSVYFGGQFKYKTQGQALHAALLGFVHPTTGRYLEFYSELPTYFSEILRKLRGEK